MNETLAAVSIALLGVLLFTAAPSFGEAINPYPETFEEIAAYREAVTEKQHERMVYPEQAIEISTLAELSEYAEKSGVYVKMKPGVYNVTVDNYKDILGTTTELRLRQSPWGGHSFRRDGDSTVEERERAYLINFGGVHSFFDLRGVTLEIDSEVANVHNGANLAEVLISGENLIVRGLSVVNVGDHHPTQHTQTFSVTGNRNLLQGVTVTSRGSRPYGYGCLLGKGGQRLTPLNKKCALGVGGYDNIFVDCEVYARSFGHAVTSGGNPSYTFIDSHIEGEVRSTDEILQETEGPAYEADFQNIWTGERIQPGRKIALCEDSFRAYPTYGIRGNENGEIKILGGTVKNTRSAIQHLFGYYDNVFVSNTTVVENEAAFLLPSGAKVVNCKADFTYGPFLRLIENVETEEPQRDIEVDIIVIPPSETGFLPEKAAEIRNGIGHRITLRAEKKIDLENAPPIVIKNSKDIVLRNETGLPVHLADTAENCQIKTNGEVIDEGQNNKSVRLD